MFLPLGRLTYSLILLLIVVFLAQPRASAAASATQPEQSGVDINLALGKYAYASSIGAPGQEPSQAVDGSTQTKWSSQLGELSWLVIDLGQRSTIHRYRLLHANPFERWQRQSINLRDFQFQVSNNQRTWITVDSVTGNLDNITDHQVTLNTAYRYVRLYITNPQTEPTYRGGRIFELEVYGQQKRLHNIAFGKPAYASSIGAAGQEPSQAVDGSTQTKWSSQLSELSWLAVDLGQRSTISRYRVLHANPFERWQRQSINLRDFQFQVSNDQQNWITVDSITNNTADITDHLVSLPGRYRYVRLYITNPQTEPTYRGGRVFEFEVYR